MYLRIYAIDMAYMGTPTSGERHRAFERRVYVTMHTMGMAENSLKSMLVMQLHPRMGWARVWKSLQLGLPRESCMTPSDE
jgi:hypothetical protein